MRGTNKEIPDALNGDFAIRVVTGLSLVGLVIVFAAIGAMFGKAVHTSAYARTVSVQAQQAPANDEDNTGKNSTSMQGEANFTAGSINVSARLGLREGRVDENRYCPYYVKLENKGKNFEGYFRIFVGESDQTTMFQKKVSIAAGETKQIESVFCPSRRYPSVTVALCDKKGNVIAKKLVILQVFTPTTSVKELGILSEDATGLGYFSGANFTISELSKEDIMEDARGLDIYDVLVISNLDTQSLSDKQIAAINSWVKDGGTLILGTGPQAEKTLKAFSGNLLNGTIGSTHTIETQFGDYDSQKTVLRQQLENDLHDEKMNAVKDFLYNNLSTSMRNMYADDIKNLAYADSEGSWKNTILSPGSDIYEELSKQYKEEELENIFEVAITDEERKSLESGLNVERITRDITTLTIEDSKSLLTENGEQLISKLDYGIGCVIVTEFDLSLDNKYWDSYGAMLKRRFYQNCATDIYSNLSSTYSADIDDDISLADGLSINDVNGLPNMALYMFLLVLYVILIGPVAYVLLRRKDKRNLLWRIIPISAVLCSVIIYLIGTSTRIQKPYVNYLSQMFIRGEGTAQLETAFSLTSPNNNAYQVELEGNMDVKPYISSSYWYGDTTSQQTNVSYKSGVEYTADSTILHMDHLSSFDSANFWNKQVVQQNGQIEFSSVNLSEQSPSGIVTNQLDFDLEDCLIVFEGNMIYLGDLAKGQSVSLDKVKSKNIHTFDFSSSDWDDFLHNVFYENYDYFNYGNRDTQKERRIALLEYYGNAYLSGNTLVPNTYFYGFRVNDEETPFNKLFSLEQYGETAVIQEITMEGTMEEGEMQIGTLSDYALSQTGASADDTGALDIQPNSSGSFHVPVTVVYNLADVQKSYKTLTAKYLHDGNQEFRLNSIQSYISSGIGVFLGTISVKNPETGEMEDWAWSGKEASLKNLENYMDESGNLTMTYTLESDDMLDGFYDKLQLPVIQIVGQ